MIILSRIATMLHGMFEAVGDNETSLVSTKDDPPKDRKGVAWQWGWGRTMGATSFNYVRPDREEEEVVLLQGKVEGGPGERYDFTDLAGEYRLDIRGPRDASDGGMKPVFRMFHDKVEFAVPVSAPNFTAPSGAVSLRTTRFYSDHGRFCINWQDDTGKPTGIVYDTKGTTDETQWVAVGQIEVKSL